MTVILDVRGPGGAELIDRVARYLQHGRDCMKAAELLLSEDGDPGLYKIVRFRVNGRPRVTQRGLTLDQAQAHCQREDTHGPGWFDGYDVDR